MLTVWSSPDYPTGAGVLFHSRSSGASLAFCRLRFLSLVVTDWCRPEKDHAKQLYSLAELFKLHPSYRVGNNKVTLTLMGGVRDAGDQGRLDALNNLAKGLGVQVR
jgi:hypothetical protein